MPSPSRVVDRSGWSLVAGAALVVALAACTSGVVDRSPERDGPIAGQSILSVDIPGTADGQVSTAADGSVTKLFDVTGDWEEVSIGIAGIAQDEGWTVSSLNCVGTGNDVIAKKLVDGQWLLLESGAGERGAGVIVSLAPQQVPPGTLTVTGRCPDALVRAVD